MHHKHNVVYARTKNETHRKQIPQKTKGDGVNKNYRCFKSEATSLRRAAGNALEEHHLVYARTEEATQKNNHHIIKRIMGWNETKKKNGDSYKKKKRSDSQSKANLRGRRILSYIMTFVSSCKSRFLKPHTTNRWMEENEKKKRRLPKKKEWLTVESP